MELQHFSHQHPLVFSQEQNQPNEKASCSGCGELVSGPRYSCVACGFYLDKKCAEAPSEINHPFHRNHNFSLLKKHPYEGNCPCDFCEKACENFVYHCSCQLDLHIKCAFLSLNIAEKRIGELQNIARIDPSISTENRFEELTKAECFACWEPLLDSVYLSSDCGFYLHAKCVDLPAETNHLFHPEHPLLLQFNNKRLPCKICQKAQWKGFVYCCSLCEFVLHIGCATIPTEINNPFYHRHPLVLQFIEEGTLCQICQEAKFKGSGYWCSTCKFALHAKCVSIPPITEEKSRHQHQFIFFPRPYSLFICDACGTQGKYVSYICSTCGIIVHKNCISVPCIIKFYRHQHNIFHTYCFEEHEFEKLECRFCYEEVNKEHGGYFCSKCKYIVHVKCAIQDPDFYEVVSAETVDEVRDSMENVTATSGKHFSHPHVLEFSEDIKNDKQCDGCGQFISTSYYYCSQRDFFLHKSCAELPTEKHMWFHLHQNLMKLTSDGIFTCGLCRYETSGFAYICGECKECFCLPCASGSDMPRCEGHEHPLPFYRSFKGSCNACGNSITHAFRCKSCNFNLDRNCLILPRISRHKSDEHPLKLTYGDNSNYSECYYCDICEEERTPNHWFYFCEICNSSAHPDCVIEQSSFIKLGSIYTKGDHPHPLTFVQKVHSYPECEICGKPCLDMALECKEIGCGYIVHWKCMKKPPSV